MGVLRASAAALALRAAGAAAVLRHGGAPATPPAAPKVAALAHDSKTSESIKPKLDPESDHVFFKEDYPHDASPPANWQGAGRPTSGVYPGFQPDDVYDKDYVNDENGDNGEWAAQSKYDNLRTMAAKVKRDAEEARRAEEDKGKDIDADKDKAAAAAAAADKARKDAEAAAADHDIAETKLKGLDGFGDKEKGSITKWRAKIAELEQQLAECKKRVAEKTALLEKLKKEAFSQAGEIAAEQKKAEQDLEVAKANLERVKASKPEGVDTQLHELATEDATLLARLQASEKAHDKAVAQYQKSKQAVVKVENEVRAVIRRIREAREAKAHPKVEAPPATPAPVAARPVVEAAESLWHRLTGEVSR